MNQTFHVSKRSLLRKRLNPFIALFLILGLVGYAEVQSNGHPGINVLGLSAFTVVIVALTWRASSQWIHWAESHSLTVTDKGLLTQDGPEEAHTSFGVIDALVVTRVFGRLVAAKLTYNKKFKESLLVYEDYPKLVGLLTSALPSAKIRERQWIHV